MKFWENIKRWFSYYKVLRNVYDFDYTSILDVEEHQIKRVRDTIIKYHNYIGWENDVEKINTALKLLNIVKEGGCSERVGSDFSIEDDNLNFYYTIPVYVNTKNYKRFWNIDSKEFDSYSFGNMYRDYLRIEKAWYLYNKLRCEYLRLWWS